jgi:hypothetical protein
MVDVVQTLEYLSDKEGEDKGYTRIRKLSYSFQKLLCVSCNGLTVI